MKTIHLKVSKLPEDARLDKVIPFLNSNFSRGATRKLIENGAVYVNQKRCHQNAKPMKIGDSIKIMVSEKEKEPEIELTPQHIIFENEDIIVMNKPPLLPTHETIDSSRFHLVLATQNLLAKRDNKNPNQIYLGVHHRLDRDTSGALLFTKRKEANAAVAQAFQEREVEKIYLAICEGKPKKESWNIQSFIGPSPKSKRVMASVKRDGKFAETDAKVLDHRIIKGRGICVVEAKPKTGRTHQIRVHLSENGYPLLGDRTYGVDFPGISRVMLHAWKLSVLGKTFTAPIPQDFQALDFQTGLLD